MGSRLLIDPSVVRFTPIDRRFVRTFMGILALPTIVLANRCTLLENEFTHSLRKKKSGPLLAMLLVPDTIVEDMALPSAVITFPELKSLVCRLQLQVVPCEPLTIVKVLPVTPTATTVALMLFRLFTVGLISIVEPIQSLLMLSLARKYVTLKLRTATLRKTFFDIPTHVGPGGLGLCEATPSTRVLFTPLLLQVPCTVVKPRLKWWPKFIRNPTLGRLPKVLVMVRTPLTERLIGPL